MDKSYSFTKEINKDGDVELTIKVNSEKFLSTKEKVYNKLSQEVTLPGFRPGKAPRALIEAQISSKVYDETLNRLIPEITAEILEESKLTPLNQVHYDLVKFTDTEGVEFKAKFVELPEIKLPDFSKIKVKKEDKQVKDEDIANEVTKIVQYYKNALKSQEKKEEGKEPEKEPEIKSSDINDEMVKSLNLGFNTLKDLQDQVRKELENTNKKNSEIAWLDSIIKEAVKMCKIQAPKSLVDESVQAKEKDYIKKLEDLNLKVDEFLKVQNTTMEKLREGWIKETENRFSEELLLLHIIRDQKILIKDEEINAELAKITDEKTKSQLETQEGKRYLVTVLLQQRAIEWLKNQINK